MIAQWLPRHSQNQPVCAWRINAISKTNGFYLHSAPRVHRLRMVCAVCMYGLIANFAANVTRLLHSEKRQGYRTEIRHAFVSDLSIVQACIYLLFKANLANSFAILVKSSLWPGKRAHSLEFSTINWYTWIDTRNQRYQCQSFILFDCSIEPLFFRITFALLFVARGVKIIDRKLFFINSKEMFRRSNVVSRFKSDRYSTLDFAAWGLSTLYFNQCSWQTPSSTWCKNHFSSWQINR